MRISYLQQEVSTMRQGDLTVTNYFTKLRIIWDKLENFRPNQICSCPMKCSCDALSSGLDRKMQDQVMQFL